MIRVEARLVLIGIRVAEISDRHIGGDVLMLDDADLLIKYPRSTSDLFQKQTSGHTIPRKSENSRVYPSFRAGWMRGERTNSAQRRGAKHHS